MVELPRCWRLSWNGALVPRAVCVVGGPVRDAVVSPPSGGSPWASLFSAFEGGLSICSLPLWGVVSTGRAALCFSSRLQSSSLDFPSSFCTFPFSPGGLMPADCFISSSLFFSSCLKFAHRSSNLAPASIAAWIIGVNGFWSKSAALTVAPGPPVAFSSSGGRSLSKSRSLVFSDIVEDFLQSPVALLV